MTRVAARRRKYWLGKLVAVSILTSLVGTVGAAASPKQRNAAEAGGPRIQQATATALAQRMNSVQFGGRPFSAVSPFNTPTPAGTKWFDTPVLHTLPKPNTDGDSRMHWYVLQPFGIYRSSESDPVWTFNMPALIAPDWGRNRPAATFSVHAPANIHAGLDTDKVLIVVDGSTYYEVWDTSVDSANRTVTGPAWATGDIVRDPGAGTVANNDGVRASNFSWAAGLITGYDLASGSIDHALAIALTQSQLAGLTGDGHIPPATNYDNGGATGPITMGSRLGIPAGVAPPADLSPVGIMVFGALQKYGAFVGDFVGGLWPAFYSDANTVNYASMDPIYASWKDPGYSSDMDKILPLLRVANYQP
jgi:hypothetical protein